MIQYIYLYNEQRYPLSLDEYVKQCPTITSDIWKNIPPSLHTTFIQKREIIQTLSDDEYAEIINKGYHDLWNNRPESVKKLCDRVPLTDFIWHIRAQQQLQEEYPWTTSDLLARQKVEVRDKSMDHRQREKHINAFMDISTTEILSCDANDLAHFFHLYHTEESNLSVKFFHYCRQHPDFERALQPYSNIPICCAVESDMVFNVKDQDWKNVFNVSEDVIKKRPHVVQYFSKGFLRSKIRSTHELEWLINIVQKIPKDILTNWLEDNEIIIEPWLWLPPECLPNFLLNYRNKRNLYMVDFCKFPSNFIQGIIKSYEREKINAELTEDYRSYSSHLYLDADGKLSTPNIRGFEYFMPLNESLQNIMIGNNIENTMLEMEIIV